MEFNQIELDEATPLTEEQWASAIAFHRKRLGKVSESVQTNLEPCLSGVKYKRLMYSEWLADECENCRTTENVTKFADRSGKTKQPIYLCRKCYEIGGGPKYLREWK